MCITCYDNFTSDEILIQINKGLKDIEKKGFSYFDTFSKTSVNFLFYITMFNDKEKGIKILELYHIYLQTQPIYYNYMYKDLDNMYHPETIKNIIIWLNSIDINLSKNDKLILLSKQLKNYENYYNRYNLYNLYYHIKHNIFRFIINNRFLKNKNILYLSNK
jgi:hypothetical protein